MFNKYIQIHSWKKASSLNKTVVWYFICYTRLKRVREYRSLLFQEKCKRFSSRRIKKNETWIDDFHWNQTIHKSTVINSIDNKSNNFSANQRHSKTSKNLKRKKKHNTTFDGLWIYIINYNFNQRSGGERVKLHRYTTITHCPVVGDLWPHTWPDPFGHTHCVNLNDRSLSASTN